MKSLPFYPEKEIFRWGPIPGKYFYDADFVKAIFLDCPKKYNFKWPKTLFLFKDGKMIWINDYDELRKVGKAVFVKYMINKNRRNKLHLYWQHDLNKIRCMHTKIARIDLEHLSNDQFLSLWDKYYKLMYKFWLPTIIPELGNYGADRYLEAELQKNIGIDKLDLVMERITAPVNLSFYQQEEFDLCRAKSIKMHTQKYFWLKNSYNGIKVLDEDYFRNRKANIDRKKLVSVRSKLRKTKNCKTEIVKKYNFSKRIIKIYEALVYGIEWQDERKKNIFITLHYKYLLLAEFARRFNYKINELENHASWEIRDMVNNNTSSNVFERGRCFGIVANTDIANLDGNKCAQYWDLYAQEKLIDQQAFLKGIVACRGKKHKILGNVSIVLDPDRDTGFTNGSVLVAHMTSPEYIFLMRNASAIVTDTGGLTSHAAIVARELNIPCIVGTKYATQLLKDGDLVEVDAKKGIVRKLN